LLFSLKPPPFNRNLHVTCCHVIPAGCLRKRRLVPGGKQRRIGFEAVSLWWLRVRFGRMRRKVTPPSARKEIEVIGTCSSDEACRTEQGISGGGGREVRVYGIGIRGVTHSLLGSAPEEASEDCFLDTLNRLIHVSQTPHRQRNQSCRVAQYYRIYKLRTVSRCVEIGVFPG